MASLSTSILLVVLVPAAATSYNLKDMDLLDTVSDILDTAIQYIPAATALIQRDDLNCAPCGSGTKQRDVEKCCACHSYPKWKGSEKKLYIEYIDVLGISIVVPTDDVRNDSVYKVELQNGKMREIPGNLCNWDRSEKTQMYCAVIADYFGNFDVFWDKVVKIDFTRNRIRQVVDLNCLSRLDTLELGYNKITHVRNTSFNTLNYLRVLNLEHNLISVMDPSVLTNPALHLTNVYLRNNELKEVDITNSLSLLPFCKIDYSHNSITTFTNVHNYTLDPKVKYGPGYVDLRLNKITTFPDLKDLLNLDSVQQLGQLMQFGFDIREVPLVCNGLIEPYLEVARQIQASFWLNYFTLACAEPKELEGHLIKDVKLDELVTNRECYQSCACQERPSQNYVYVDCSGKGITDLSKAPLPDFPYCENIHLNLSNNDIRIVENVANLDKVRVLDLSNNDVVGISQDAGNSLFNITLNLKNNTNLKTLPEQFRYLSSCNLYIESVLDCGCDSKWMSEWSNKSDCGDNDTTLFKCKVPNHGVMSVKDFDKNMLDCDDNDIFIIELAILLAVSLLIVIITAVITHRLRYELLVIFLRLRKIKKNQVSPSLNYDAYFSFDEEDDIIRKWVNTELIPQLEDKGYQNFLSYRDLDIGSIRDYATIDVLTKTRNFVVILSKSYLDHEDMCWTTLEWKYGWHMYKSNSHTNIVLINYDYISSFDVGHPQIKAFLRVGGQVNFTNESRDIIDHISRKLGPPIPKITCTKQSFVNHKARFDVTSLFLVDHLRNKIDPLKETNECTDKPDRYSYPIKDKSKPVFSFQRYK